MKESNLIVLLESVLGDSKSARNGLEAVFKCPHCHHHKHKLTINLQTQQFQCWVCNFHGRGIHKIFKVAKADSVYFKQLDDINKQSDFEIASNLFSTPSETPPLGLPEGYIPLWKKTNSLLRKKALSYLNSRNISAYDIVKYNIGYAESGVCDNMIIVPSYDEYGTLNFWVGRSFQENHFPTHKLAPISRDIIGFDLHINWDLPIVICEGVYDAITIRHNAIPLFGKKISKTLLSKIIESDCKEVYIALDKDAILDALQYGEKLLSMGKLVYIVELDEKDPNTIGYEGMQTLLKNTKNLTYSSLIQKKILYQ